MNHGLSFLAEVVAGSIPRAAGQNLRADTGPLTETLAGTGWK